MQINLEQMVATLQNIQRDHGDLDFHLALKALFRNLLTTDEGVKYTELLLERLGHPAGLDLKSIRAEHDAERRPAPPAKARAQASAETPAQAPEQAGPAQTPAEVVEAAIKQAVPNCKTQAHFDLILQMWQALTLYVNAAYGFDVSMAVKAREGLNRLLDLAPQLAAVHEKLRDNPEATTNRDYVDPPKQSTEAKVQMELLAEVAALQSQNALTAWYQESRPLMDQIVNQRLRDGLFDAIRAKKQALTN